MNQTKQIVYCGFGMAVIFVLTAFIAIPIGQFGYVNLGDCGVMLFASALNPALAFICGGIGSALSDVYLGFSQYAIFTLIIKGLEALCVSVLYKRMKGNMKWSAFIPAVIIMVGGYFITDTILLSNATAALGGVPFNLVQGVTSFLIASVASLVFTKQASNYFAKS